MSEFVFPDLPSQVPPLTPGTNQKMAQAISASFSSWEKEREQFNITEGKAYTSHAMSFEFAENHFTAVSWMHAIT